MSIQQITEQFVGRNREKNLFVEWLDNPAAPRIFYLYDFLAEEEKKGGVGKTWLLHEYVAFVSQQRQHIFPIFVDFFNIVERDGIEIARIIIKQLQGRFPAWLPQSFTAALDKYEQACLLGSLDVSRLRDQLGSALATDLQELRRQFLNTDNYILIVFDTFELVEQDPLTAVLHSQHKFPDDYGCEQLRFVIAGRNAPDFQHSNWSGREHEIDTISLKPFAYDEMIQFLNTRSNIPPDLASKEEQLPAIYKLTEGRPILVGLVSDILNYQRYDLNLDTLVTAPDAPEFMRMLIERLLFTDLSSTKMKVILYMAHIYHRFNKDLLARAMTKLGPTVSQDEQKELLTDLLELSFVRRSSNLEGFVLHDEVHRLINRYCWPRQDDRTNRVRRELSELAIQYYDSMLGTDLNEQMRQSYMVEKLFHEIFRDKGTGLTFFEEQFKLAIKLWMRAFARSLLQEVKKFEQELSTEQLCRVKMAEAKLLGIEENPMEALALYEGLECNTTWFAHHRLEVLFGKGDCFRQMSQFAEATNAFLASLETEDLQEQPLLHATILDRLGYVYFLQGELEAAVDSYEKSLKAQRGLDNQSEYAETLNSLGNTYRRQGKIEQALQLCKIALHIRHELLREGKISERYIALSQSTIGQIYLDRAENLRGRDERAKAEKCFQEALAIYRHVGYHRGIAATYNRLGQVQMAQEHVTQEDRDEALRLFRKAYDTSLCIDIETRMISLNRQGRVLVQQGNDQEAIACFGQAIELARQGHHCYEEAESLIDLALVPGQAAEATERVLKKAFKIAYQHKYYYLIAHAEHVNGTVHYKAKEYWKAFKHFAIACRYMAFYNRVCYENHLRDLLDRLLDIPSTHLPGIVDLLSSYWQDMSMERDYPELLNICKAVSKHIIL